MTYAIKIHCHNSIAEVQLVKIKLLLSYPQLSSIGFEPTDMLK